MSRAILPSTLCALAWAVVLVPGTGCVIEDNRRPPPESTCAIEPTYSVDTGASIDHVAGVDAGYYVEYRGAGAWHLEWTCDTKLSAFGCNFTGTIVATLARGSSVTCAQCEPEDVLTVTPRGTETAIQFDTVTASGIDGIDFTTPVGGSIEADLLLDGVHQNDLVFLPSGRQAANPSCMPAKLAAGAELPTAGSPGLQIPRPPR